MRRLCVLFAAGAAFFALVATAVALTNNTVNYTVKAKHKGKASKKHPAPISYEGILDVGTTNGTQPNVAPTTKIYFPKQIKQNAKDFPSCNPKALDGADTVPASCKKAQIGTGVAKASAGSPGQPINPATSEDLSVKAYNGPKGKSILLAVTGTSPLAISNRVIPGKLGPGGGKFGYTVTFAVPQDLQFQLGFQVALTHFDVKISSKKFKVKHKGKKVRESYLVATSCPKAGLPTKTTVNFAQDGTPGQPAPPGGQSVTSESTFKC